jgi:hypothetical protein
MDETLVHFATERESIRQAKESGLAPKWTRDEILARYKFTNVRRRDDRVSKWIIEHLIAPAADAPDLWFTLLIARLINWPPTLAHLLDARVLPAYPEAFNAEAFVKVLNTRASLGYKNYTGAYVVYPTLKNPGMTKAELMSQYIIGDVIKQANTVRTALARCRVEDFVESLSKCYGVGTFMAGQVAADLTYSQTQLGHASDLYTYAPKGPGSQFGLNMLHDFPKHHSWEQFTFNKELVRIRSMLETAGLTGLTLHDVQNVMCEFGKYAKVLTGQGAPRSLYKPETEF